MEHIKKYWIFYLIGLAILMYGIWYFGFRNSNTEKPKNQITPTASINLKITNPNGAEIYNKDSANGMKGTGQTVPSGTTLSYTNKVNSPYCPSSSQTCFLAKDFYQTPSGFLLATDVTTL